MQVEWEVGWAARLPAAGAATACSPAQHQLRRRDAAIDVLRAQLTRMEAKHRASINSLSPGKGDGEVLCLVVPDSFPFKDV